MAKQAALKNAFGVLSALDDDVVKFHDLNYSFEEVLSVAKKIEQVQNN